MCDPVSMFVATTALSVVTGVAGYVGQQQQANAENSALQANLRSEYSQGQQQQIFHNDEAAQKLDANQRASKAAQAHLVAGAAENGVAGNSILAISNELAANTGHYASDVEYNRAASDEEIRLQMKGFQNETQGHINQIQQPSILGTVGQIASSSIKGYGAAFPYTPPDPSLAIPAGVRSLNNGGG